MSEPERDRIEPIAIASANLTPLQILGNAVAGEADTILLDNGQPQGTTPRPANLADQRDAFAVYCVGSSMEPRYFPGEILHIHPNKPCRQGNYVLVAFLDGMATVKRLVSQSDEKVVVEQHNPPKRITYERSKIKRLFRIVGTRDD